MAGLLPVFHTDGFPLSFKDIPHHTIFFFLATKHEGYAQLGPAIGYFDVHDLGKKLK